MEYLAKIGNIIQVTPWDSLCVTSCDETFELIEDPTPFEFSVEGKLEDGQLFYGLYGPVTSGPDRYANLICNIIIRADGSDWRRTSICQAGFIVGPGVVKRDHRYDFRHPYGSVIDGLPVIGRFGEIRVVS